jgi:ribosome-associated toxin RatA of RatAB toxin-antitoxin module
MREIKRFALVAQPPARMFALINDIERYPQFVPWVTQARIESRTAEEIVATLSVKRGALHTEFTTRNILEPDTRITLRLVKGPFNHFEGEWRLTPVGATGCKVELILRFSFANRLAGVVLEPLFESTAATLVDAFVARARTLPA